MMPRQTSDLGRHFKKVEALAKVSGSKGNHARLHYGRGKGTA